MIKIVYLKHKYFREPDALKGARPVRRGIVGKVFINKNKQLVGYLLYFERGTVAISSSRSSESGGKVTKIKVVASATSAEHNIAPKIQFQSNQVKFQVRDVQLQSEWTEQYVYDVRL